MSALNILFRGIRLFDGVLYPGATIIFIGASLFTFGQEELFLPQSSGENTPHEIPGDPYVPVNKSAQTVSPA